MSYKTSLLKETKELIEKTKNEIRELAQTNINILKIVTAELEENKTEVEFLLRRIDENMQVIAEKEAIIKVYKNDLEKILKMKEVA